MDSRRSSVVGRGLATHHAYVVSGRWSEVREVLTAEIEHAFGTPLRGNPDYWFGEFETLGIDDARGLAESQSRKALSGGHKIFIVAFNFITSEAQNALLKVFEEPTAHTHFFVVTPLADTLLPTLRSRLAPLVLTKDERQKTKDGDRTAEFLSGDIAVRQNIIRPLVEEKDKVGALALLDGLEGALHASVTAYTKADTLFALREIVKMRGYLRDRAPSVKMILEYVALIVPRI